MNKDSATNLIEIIDETVEKIFKESNEETKKFYYHIIETITEVVRFEGYCSDCGEELRLVKRRDYMGDFQGTPVYEDVETYVCEKGHKLE